MEPYERLLTDALHGDKSLFGSEAAVEAAWRIVDPVLNTGEAPTPLRPRNLRTRRGRENRGDRGRLDQAS